MKSIQAIKRKIVGPPVWDFFDCLGGYYNIQLLSVITFDEPYQYLYDLTTETIQCLALSLQSINHIHCSHCLTTCMFCISYRITNNIFKKHLEYTTSLFINKTTDTLYTATTSKTTNGRLCNTLDIITKDLAMTFRASFSKTFASFSSA